MGAIVVNGSTADASGEDTGSRAASSRGALPVVPDKSRTTPRRLLWARALPGTVMVAAALALPEFSVGAGDLPPLPRDVSPLPGKATGIVLPFAANVQAAEQSVIAPTLRTPAAVAGPVTVSRIRAVDAGDGFRPSSLDISEPRAFGVGLLDRGYVQAEPSAPMTFNQAPALAAVAVEQGVFVASGPDTVMAMEEAETPVLSKPVAAPTLGLLTGSLAVAAAPFEPVAFGPVATAGKITTLPQSSTMTASAPAAAQTLSSSPLTAPQPRLPAIAAASVTTSATAPDAPPPGAISTAASRPRPAPPALAGIPRGTMQTASPARAMQAADALDITSRLLTRIDGKAAGEIDFRQTSNGLQVRIGSLAEVLADRFDQETLARMRSSSSSNVYLSLAQLQRQGIPISYDPVYDEFNIGDLDTRPKAASKVHMEQLTTPERGPGSVVIAPATRRR